MLGLAYWLLGSLHLLLLEYAPDSDAPENLGDAANQPPELDIQSQTYEPSTGQTKWIYWLFDPARFVIFTLSLLLITHASRRAVHLDKDSKDSQLAEGVHDLAWYHAICLPFFGSLILIIFFYFFDTIQFIYTILCAIVSIVAMYNLLYPAVDRLSYHCRTWLQFSTMGNHQYITAVVVTAAISVTITTLWVLSGHWICLDALGAALCVLMIQYVRVPNLKVSTMLLVGLLLYDVFWVFYSSSVFEQNVMLEVAVKRARNPVAIVADKLDLPEVARSRPPLSIPGKLLVPSMVDGKTFAMLGLGDIVLPGFLLCFAMRFDSFCQPSTSSQRFTRGVLLCKRWFYFTTALAGYAIGLTIASVVADVTRAAQPALLYLVPCILVPLLVKATLQGDFRAMWTGPFSKPQNSGSKGYQQVSQYSVLPT